MKGYTSEDYAKIKNWEKFNELIDKIKNSPVDRYLIFKCIQDLNERVEELESKSGK